MAPLAAGNIGAFLLSGAAEGGGKGGKKGKGGKNAASPLVRLVQAVTEAINSAIAFSDLGDGTVITIEGQGEYARVQINFEDLGSKWLVLAYANLKPS